MKSMCQDWRRISPSVTACSPTACCIATFERIASSSTSRSRCAVIVPARKLSRAAFTSGGRSRLPTWSARNGGLIRGLKGCLLCVVDCSPRRSAPDRAGNRDDQLELGTLAGLADRVDLHHRGKRALGAQRQPLELDMGSGLLDAPLELLGALHRRTLGRHEPQHHGAVLGHAGERLETAGALVVVLEQEAIERAALEQPPDRAVVALGVEPALV